MQYVCKNCKWVWTNKRNFWHRLLEDEKVPRKEQFRLFCSPSCERKYKGGSNASSMREMPKRVLSK